jgi:hypothetical protein
VTARRGVVLLLAVCSGALLAYSSARAERVSFTHDESISFRIVQGDLSWKETGNHHPLNTRLMAAAHRRLGSREWMLRLPNVLAHAVYLAAGLLFLAAIVDDWAVMLLGFALLNLNPFVLDFFSLARGYGLALGLSLAALFFLVRAYQQSQFSRAAALAIASTASAALADLAHFGWLNFHVALLPAVVIVLVARAGRNTTRTALLLKWFVLSAIVAANGVFIRNVVYRLWNLVQRGELYSGGRTGLIADTMVSLVESYFYGRQYSLFLQWIIVGGLVVITVAAVVTVLGSGWKPRQWSLPAVVAVVLVLAEAEPVAEHVLLGTVYQMGRYALYLVPIICVFATVAANQIIRIAATRQARRSAAILSNSVRTVCVLLSLGMVAHFAATANLHSTRDWAYDADTKAAILEVDRQSKALFPGRSRIHLTNHWVYEPSLTYYRTLLHFDWLEVAPRDAMPTLETDFYYGSETDLRTLDPALKYTIIKGYSHSETVLARIAKTP